MNSERARLLKLATTASVLTAAFLMLLKLYAWQVTDSVSILASFIDSLMDISASAINLVAVRFALKPADDDHSFGHGKAESLAGLGQALFITGSALFLIAQSIERLQNPMPLQAYGIGMAVMLISMAATLGLLTLQRYVIKKTNSTAIKADSLHYASDLATNGATLLAILLVYVGVSQADPYLALAISAYILYSAYQIALEAINQLMDKELPDEERLAIENIVTSSPNVIGMHDLRTWQSGNRKIIQFHIELDSQLTLKAAHHISKQVELKILEIEPDADIIIHQDPIDEGEEYPTEIQN
jgi:ferrous-iron efflux pump FieF